MPLIALTSVTKAAFLLKKGEVVIYPTETAYALGCDAANREAVQKIFRLKGRGFEKTLPVIVADMPMAKRYAVFSQEALSLAAEHWPGALTLILPMRKRMLAIDMYGKNTLALRVSGRRLARALSKSLGRPLVSTSANISGQPTSYSLRRLRRYFQHSEENVYVLDAGTLVRRRTSTILDCTVRPPRVVRRGAVKIL